MKQALRLLWCWWVFIGLGGCTLGTGFLVPGKLELKEHMIEGSGASKVVLIDVRGIIHNQPRRGPLGLGSKPGMVAQIDAQFNKAAKDRRIKAVVLLIDSPGGEVSASDQLYHLVRNFRLRTHKPVVAHMQSMAASGGYYVACGANKIIALPSTLTGSIGVIIAQFEASELMRKLGVHTEVYKSGVHKDILSPWRQADSTEHAIIDRLVTDMQKRFLNVVKTSRHVDIENPAWLDGRPLNGIQAQKYGLIDALGQLPDAISLAKSLADIDKARIVRYHYSTDPAPASIYASGFMPPAPNPWMIPKTGLWLSGDPGLKPAMISRYAPFIMQGHH